MIKGIDISYAQKNVDFSRVKNDGVEFVIIRAGYGREVSQKDARFEEHYAGARANNIKIGAYWYSYAETAEDAKLEAKACLEVISGKTFEYPVAFDIEESRCIKNASAICKAFCEEVEKAGYYVMIYSSKSYLLDYISKDLRSRYDVWVAHTGVEKTTYPDNFGIWQYSHTGKVNGVSGNADLNYAYKNYPEIIRNAGLNGFAATPVSADTPKLVNPYRVPSRNIRTGSIGEDVKWVQQALINKGFGVGKCGVDGIVGTDTDKAIRAFQSKNDLIPDGIVGPLTRGKLNS